MKRLPKQILKIVEQLKEGESSRRFKVRAVLKWFGASRRGANVVSDIKTALAALGLETAPTLDNVDIDDPIRFVRVAGSDERSNAAGPAAMPETSMAETDDAPVAQAESTIVSNGVESSHELEDQLEPETEDEQPISKPDDRPVTSQGSDWTISSLRDKLERGQLDLQPKFQREYVWDQRPELPSRLIESALLEIPIPPIYFGRVSEGRLEIIDG